METIALYMRFSGEDEKIGESCSIGSQRELLYGYLKEHHEFCNWNILEFCDDGYSGANFERPGIQKLLSLAGETVNCIIVKDFSRFGRNLIEVGDYLDQIFPFLGVRFIAVNEGYDSKLGLGSCVSLDVSLKNMVYEMYSRDISEKICCVKRAKMRRGEYMGNIAFYGYKMSKVEKNKLVIDEPAAEVVRRIFRMAVEGISIMNIAVALNEEGIPSPLMYRRENHTEGGRKWRAASNTTYWERDNVKRILSDERYTGCLVGHKREKIDISMKTERNVPKEEWIVVENVHDAIISKEIFEQAQAHRRKCGHRKTPQKPYRLFRGILKCKYCGRTLVQNGSKQIYYCTTGKVMTDLPCADIFLNKQELEKTLLIALQTLVQLKLQSDNVRDEEQPHDIWKKKLLECQAASNRYKTMQTMIFEDYAEGRISRKEYLSRKKEAFEKQNEAARQYRELVEQSASDYCDMLFHIDKLEKYNFTKLTREMLEEFVREIRVSGKDTIEIVWKFRDGMEKKV